ncbi:MAG: hypothetical protein ACJ8DI_16645 [Ktedonobacteraceae bacterium]
MMMSKYIFLDTWTLDKYTKARYAQHLANFIKSNGYTIVFNGLSMAELYNSEWEKGGTEERGARVARFLGDQHCIIVRPEEVWQAEAAIFPRHLDSLPIKLNIDTLPNSQRIAAMLSIFRRDQTLLDEGMDIAQWRSQYDALKSQWLADVEKIIEEGVRQETIIKATQNRYKAASSEKREAFLRSLDWRLTNKSTYYSWQDTSVMRSIRFSSLCLWYHYIDYPAGETPKKSPSDIGDIFQLSLAPYCDVITTDTKIAPTLKRVLHELSYACQILTYHELEMELGIES